MFLQQQIIKRNNELRCKFSSKQRAYQLSELFVMEISRFFLIIHKIPFSPDKITYAKKLSLVS